MKANEYFNSVYDEGYVASIRGYISKFLLKGKPITFADFQDIVQDALESLRGRMSEVFSVVDFEVTTGMDRKARASVTVMLSGAKL